MKTYPLYNPYTDDPKYKAAESNIKSVIRVSSLYHTYGSMEQTNLLSKIKSERENFYFHIVHDFYITTTPITGKFKFYYVNRNNMHPNYFVIEECSITKPITRLFRATYPDLKNYASIKIQNYFLRIRKQKNNLHVVSVDPIPTGTASKYNAPKGYVTGYSSKSKISSLDPVVLKILLEKTQQYPSFMMKYHELSYAKHKIKMGENNKVGII